MEPVEFGTNGETEPPVGEVEVPEEYSLASPFLNGMPEEHRTLLSPYVKKWDGQVTKRFQDYSNRLKPYEALGPVEELQKYTNFANNFRNDPENLFRLMWRGLYEQYGDTFTQELIRILELEDEMSDDYAGYDQEQQQPPVGPDPNEAFQQNVLQELQELRQWKENFEQQQQESIQQEQLDDVLSQMHNAYGDFNDDFIVLELSKHGDVQQAMQAWNALIGKYSSSQQTQPVRQAPKIMGGQGGVPSGQVDTDKLRGADRKQAVANMLAQLEG